jgi:hypothetical protein
MIFFGWLTDESWGFLRFLADEWVGFPWSIGRFLAIGCWIGLGFGLARLFERLGLVRVSTAIQLVAILLVFLFVWAVSIGRLLLFFPFPSCCNGKCRDITAYEWRIGYIYGRKEWGVYHYRCRCGDEYIREGKRFLRVLPDGSKEPYMILTGFRKWEKDKTPIKRSR